MKLNIGAGNVDIPGFTAIDRKLGTEAYPLAFDTNSVEEIRASHILEHFSFADARNALHDWVRVLQPGGRLRVAVPDVDKCLAADPDMRLFYLMGGQTDENDFHKSAFDKKKLQAFMEDAGLVQIATWTSQNTDTASHPVSLNLEGFKPAVTADEVEHDLKVGAYLTLPRYEAVAARVVIEQALKPLGIPLSSSQGVFWGQCMQRMFEEAVDKGLDWILSLDSDSLFTAQQLSALFDEFARTPQADAMAALQCRRGKPFPLMTLPTQDQDCEVATDGSPILVATAHFGLTLIRVESLLEVPKPWFKAEPDKDGCWGDERLDDDIWFWHQWRLSGKTIYVSPRVSIGHLEETVAVFDDDLKPKHIYVQQWREQNGTDTQ